MNDLVSKLSTGEHPVVVSRAEGSARELKNMIDRDYVLVKFTETRGGTELGYRLDRDHTDLNGADFESGSGKVLLAGNLNLNFVDVRCYATIDLSTLNGSGRLEVLNPN